MEADVRDLFDEDALFDPFDDGPDGDFDPEAAAQVTVGAPLTAEEAAPKAAAAPAVDTRTAQERFRDLLKETPGQRCVMLTLVDYAREPKTGAEMDVRTEELLRYGFSIYSPVVFRELLEEAGALRYMLLDDEGNEIAVDEAAGGVAGEADAQSGMDDAAAETVVAGSDVAVGAVSGAASSSARAAALPWRVLPMLPLVRRMRSRCFAPSNISTAKRLLSWSFWKLLTSVRACGWPRPRGLRWLTSRMMPARSASCWPLSRSTWTSTTRFSISAAKRVGAQRRRLTAWSTTARCLRSRAGIPAISSVAWSAKARLSGAAVGAPRRLAAT